MQLVPAAKANTVDSVVGKCARHIVPLALLGFLLCYLDRTNIGMASLTMNPDLGITPAVYGWGVGLFFWGYCLCEVPSGMALKRFGARIWIARILVVWGLASMAMAWVWNKESYYVCRFVLGVAEAGFVPGIIYYFREWFPERFNNRMVGLFLLSNPLAGLIGNPISGLLLKLDQLLGLKGWQWLFLTEGLPTVLFGFLVYVILPDSPTEVSWLRPEEKRLLATQLDAERMRRNGIRTESIIGTLFNVKVWVLSTIYLAVIIGLYGVGFFLPQIVKGFGLSNTAVGVVAAIPSLFGAVAMVLWSRHSDKTGERGWHTAIGCFFALFGLALAAYATSPVVSMIGLTLASMGTLAGMVTFWSMPNALVTGGQAAAAFALINTIGSMGGIIGPNIMGLLREQTGDFRVGLLGLAACQIIGIGVALYFRKSVNLTGRKADGQAQMTPLAGLATPQP